VTWKSFHSGKPFKALHGKIDVINENDDDDNFFNDSAYYCLLIYAGILNDSV
jgi:hypothetical protein